MNVATTLPWLKQWLHDEGHCVPSVATLATDEVSIILYQNTSFTIITTTLTTTNCLLPGGTFMLQEWSIVP